MSGKSARAPGRRAKSSRPRVRPIKDQLLSRLDFKLREARFFLSELEVVNGQPARLDPEAFAFFFSAFVSAAFSVTYMLRDESWFRSWVDALPDKPDRELMVEMESQRGAEIHAEGAALKRGTRTVERSWIDSLRAEQLSGELTQHRVAVIATMLNRPAAVLAPGTAGPADAGGFVSYIEMPDFQLEVVEGRTENALELCRRLLRLLEQLVGDFKTKGPT